MSDPRTVPTQQLFRQWRGGDAESGQNMAQRFSDWYYAVTSSRLGDAHGRVPLQNSCTRFQQGIVTVAKETELVAWAHDILAEELKSAGGRIPGGDFPNQITGGRSPTELLALAKAALPAEEVRLLAHAYDSAWPLDELTKEAEGLGGMPLAVLRARYALKRWLQQNMGIGFTEVPDEPNLDYAPLPLYEASRMSSATEETNFEKWLLSNMGLCKDIAEFGVFALALRGGAFKAAAVSSPGAVVPAPAPPRAAPVPTPAPSPAPAAPASGSGQALMIFGVVAALGLAVLVVVALLEGSSSVGDLVGNGPRDWTLDPAARHAMLLDASRTALAQGDHTAAVVLAEELLDEAPDDVDALLTIAAAAPAYGHGEVGALAAQQAAKRGADVGSLEAAALLAACQVERALDAADAALVRAPGDARAHLVRGVTLELSGRAEEAAVAYARATALDAKVLPPPISVPSDEWESLLFAATAGLDAPLRDALRGVSLDFEDLPSVALLRGLQPPPSPLVDALLLDADQPDQPDTAARRPRIAIYRRNLLRGAASVDEVEARLQRALEAEAALLLQDDP